MWPLLTPLLGKLFDQIFPDPKTASDAKLKLLEMQQAGDLAHMDADVRQALAQAEINKVEAASGSLLRAGWRPAAGWVCVFGFGYEFLLRPLLPWILGVLGAHAEPLPQIDIEFINSLLFALLGLSGVRSFDKLKGTA